MAFAVSYFPVEDAYQAIPLSWFANKKQTMCYWPPLKTDTKLQRAAKQALQPCSNSWIQVPVKLLKTAGQYLII